MILKNRKPKNLLKELEITEVSLVDRGSNEGAKVLIWKRDGIDFNKIENLSVEKLTKAMASIDYAKLGTTPEELWENYIAEVMANHNTELAQRQKHPPERLSMQEVKELRQKKPWTLLQATTAARKTNIGQSLWQLVQSCVREREAALLEKLDKMDEDLEAMKAMAQNTVDIYKRIKRGRKIVMKTIEEVTQAAKNGEFSDKLKAWEAVEKVILFHLGRI